jgi:hypothetical protein
MGDGEEGDAVELDALQRRIGVEDHVERQVGRLVQSQPSEGAAKKAGG